MLPSAGESFRLAVTSPRMTDYWFGFLSGALAVLLPSLAALAWYAWHAPVVEDASEAKHPRGAVEDVSC